MNYILKPVITGLLVAGGVTLIVFGQIAWGIFAILMGLFPMVLFS